MKSYEEVVARGDQGRLGSTEAPVITTRSTRHCNHLRTPHSTLRSTLALEVQTSGHEFSGMSEHAGVLGTHVRHAGKLLARGARARISLCMCCRVRRAECDVPGPRAHAGRGAIAVRVWDSHAPLPHSLTHDVAGPHGARPRGARSACDGSSSNAATGRHQKERNPVEIPF